MSKKCGNLFKDKIGQDYSSFIFSRYKVLLLLYIKRMKIVETLLLVV